MKINVIILFYVFWIFVPTQAQSSDSQQSKVVDCSHATISRPKIGNSFQGLIINEDYAFTVKIPGGYTGWDGVDQNAPFHGFTIFLDQKMDACINFEIHIQVDEAEAPKPPRSAKLLRLGESQAWQSISKDQVGKITMVNIRTSFSFKQAKQIDNGEVILVTPISHLSETKHIYDDFVRSLIFRTK
ncbi:hypothetical protein [Methylomonas sp. AM2-LC]|uniref:hypothetical protein n=1 Tax=Methylomonas sp. AM2-LC TaxID=3153301 RepID=UPI003264BD66